MRRRITGRRSRDHSMPGDESRSPARVRLAWGLDKLITPVLVGLVLALFGILAPPWIAKRLQTPTCQDPGDLVLVTPTNVDGSSKPPDNFQNKGAVTYGPTNLVDGNTSTAWVEGMTGLGLGAQLTVELDPNADVRLVCIVDGYAESWDLYKRNSRARLLRVDSDQGTRTALLVDAGSPDRPAVYQQLNTAMGPTTHLTLTIVSAYAAQRDSVSTTAYPDTSISEVEVWAAP
jgi:hypothetical protein